MPNVQPTDAALGATINDIDLANLDETGWKLVDEAFHQYGVLIFPGQHLSDEAQVAFALRFGALETKLANISNKRADDSVVDEGNLRYWILRGNERWHSDSSFMPLSAKASMLTAMAIPEVGGETEWADMRAGYEALDEEMRGRIEGLCALHSNYYSHEMLGQKPETDGQYGFHTKGAPLRPLVKTHPVTRRKSLFIGRHAYGIPGMSDEESAALLTELLEIAAQPPRVIGHQWEIGDLVVWDNRCILHRVQPYDYSQKRIMRHTRVAGDPISELAGTLPDIRSTTYDP
ncbi:MAG: TauD/TfdA family dioxygenase, partial [Pseudomonadota bacterium]